MTKKAAANPPKNEVNAVVDTALAAESSAPAIAAAAVSEPKKVVATVAAAKKATTKPKLEKQAATAKPAKKPVAEKPLPAANEENAAVAPKVDKAPKVKKQAPKKAKLVRDSFTMPEADYALFATLKQRALTAGVEVKKSEILRAAMLVLSNLDDAELAKAIGSVERIKTGRPKK